MSPLPLGSEDPELEAQFAQGYRAILEEYPWNVEEALRVVACESSGDPSAYYDGNYGLFQINAVHWRRVNGNLESLFDPAVNVRVAYEIWADQGWAPWACRP